MTFEPLPQQVHMVSHMLDRPSALLFSDPGLGKSAATLEVIAQLIGDHTIRAALIIAPLRVCTMTWPSEVEKYDRFAWMRVADLRTAEGKEMWRRHAAEIYLLNPEQLVQFVTQPWGIGQKGKIPADMLVVDELSKFKDPGGKRGKALFSRRSLFSRHVGLTGSPAANGLLDLFSQVRLIDGGQRLGLSFTAFRDRYFTSDYMGWKWTPREAAKGNIERRIADITLTQRREEWLDLPPTSIEDIDVALPTPLRAQYRTFQRQLLTEIKGRVVVAVNAAALIQKLLQFTSGAVYDEDRLVNHLHDEKIKALQALMKRLKAPVLVATAFIHERERIVRMVEGAEEFSEARLGAWNKGEIPCWVADPRSVGHGLNLQHGCANIVWFTLTYSYESYDQFNCRVIRTGQTKPTTIWRLLVPGTVDEAVTEALRAKGEGQDILRATLQNLERLERLR